MNASCLDEKGRFKSCPYRVYTDEHKAILRGQGDFTSQCFYSDLRYAVCDYNSRRCGKDYRIVVLKTVEVKRVIDYDCEEGYAWK